MPRQALERWGYEECECETEEVERGVDVRDEGADEDWEEDIEADALCGIDALILCYGFIEPQSPLVAYDGKEDG